MDKAQTKSKRQAAGKRPAKRLAPGKLKRFDVPEGVAQLVWIRAAGHCEQCGADLTVDLRSGRRVKLGDVAHIQPASIGGPRAPINFTPEEAKRLSSDPGNLMLLCRDTGQMQTGLSDISWKEWTMSGARWAGANGK